MDGTSRVTGDCHARFCERLGVKFPGPTRRCRATDIPTATRTESVFMSGELRWNGDLRIKALTFHRLQKLDLLLMRKMGVSPDNTDICCTVEPAGSDVDVATLELNPTC